MTKQGKCFSSAWAEYASELGGMAFFMFCTVGIDAAWFAPESPLVPWVPSEDGRRAIVGFSVGIVFLAIALSPLGRLSGAHVNPVISLAFYLTDKMKISHAVGYVVAQCIGASIGVWWGAWLLGPWGEAVQEAALHPGPNVDALSALLGEVVVTFILVSMVLFFLHHATLMRWTAWMVMVLIGLLVTFEGPISGCGFNPARWLGSALVARQWSLGWVYVVGPVIGTLLAVAGCRWLTSPHHKPRTGKIHHDSRYRSLFLADRAS